MRNPVAALNWQEPLLRSRIGRRLLLVFGGCALVPVLVLAALTINSVSSRLHEDDDQRLQRETKTAGLILAQRLHGLEADLRMLQESILEHEPEPAFATLNDAAKARVRADARRMAVAALPYAVRDRLEEHFEQILIEDGGVVHTLLGAATDSQLRRPDPIEQAHLAAGGAVLRHAASERLLQMSVAVEFVHRERGTPATARLLGTFQPSRLAMADGIPAAEGHLAVLDPQGRPVFGKLPAAMCRRFDGSQPAERSGHLRWRTAGDAELTGRFWQLYLQPRYATTWTVVLGRDFAAIDAPLRDFQFLFLLTTLLTVLIAVGLGLFQLRQLLQPIERIEEATRSLATGDLTARVGLAERDDEFGDLARSFDTMTERLAASEADLVAARDSALAAARTESDFLTNVSHEIRTPLTGIVSSAEILRDFHDGDPETHAEFTGVILDQALHLSRLIDDVLALSGAGVSSANEPRAPRPIDLPTTVQRAIDRLPEEHRGRVRTDFAKDLPAVPGDAEQLEQLWFQLLDNAAKFSPPHEKIAVRGRIIADELVVKVVDHGVGIAPEYHETIFERFRQVGRDIMTDKASGAGLGLSLARTIVEGHGGKIEVQSEFGIGATFKITLPMQGQVAAAAAASTAPSAVTE